MMSFEDAGKEVPSDKYIISILIPEYLNNHYLIGVIIMLKRVRFSGLTDNEIMPYGPERRQGRHRCGS